ncbi:hypothetical protein EDC01DRAFT_651173 [Geopyxis carbonaria]|nr:hypothetical protein EDC01DRAFT_651173 [Geopyxis carbonaria]
MAVIEELPELPTLPPGMENLDLNDMIKRAADAHFNPPGAAPGAELPAAIAAVKSQTPDEFLKQLNKMPLFMTSLDETGEDDSAPNDALEAIKALQYEGSPRDIALNFKTQGNDCFKAKQYRDAREYYTKALRVDCDDAELQLDCTNNRAQCNLLLGNYAKCIADCRAALSRQPQREKPWFRAARALLAIDRVPEAAACIENAMALKPEHAQIAELAVKIRQRGDFLAKKEAETKAREAAKASAARDIAIALQARGIVSKKTSAEPWAFAEEYPIAFTAPGDPRTPLVFPTVLVYYVPGTDLTRLAAAKTDLVARFSEQSSIGEQLAEVLAQPLPWDGAREFTPDGVEAYLETLVGGLVKWGRRVSLMEVLAGGKTAVLDGVVVAYVVPKALGKRFVEDWRKMKMRV